MYCIRRHFLSQPIVHTDHLLFQIAQVVVSKHNERAGLIGILRRALDLGPRFRGTVGNEPPHRTSFDNHVAPKEVQDIWLPYQQYQYTRSYDQCTSQVRSQDLAQLDESDSTPMILRSHQLVDHFRGCLSCVHRIQWYNFMQKRGCSCMEC